MASCRLTYLALVLLLLLLGSSSGWADPLGQKITAAVNYGDVGKVAALLALRPSLVNARDSDGMPPLYWAALGGNRKMALLLLAHGASVDAHPSGSHDTALHCAVANGDREMALLLLQHGGHEVTPIFDAIARNQLSGLAYSLDKDHDKRLQSYRANGQEVDYTLNHVPGQKDEMLLGISQSLGYSITPLYAAVFWNRPDAVLLLLAHGARINDYSENETPLHEAVGLCDLPMVTLLLNKGANVNAATRSGVQHHPADYDLTPLHFAAACPRPQIALLLLSRGANVNARDHFGMTPLHNAVEYGNLGTAALLLAHGALVNARDTEKQTPLDVAITLQHTEVANLLRQRGGRE